MVNFPNSHLPRLALSVRQPWAWAIIQGYKDVENRDYPSWLGTTPLNVCIHASMGMTKGEYEEGVEFIQSLGIACPRPDVLTRGGIVGTVTVCRVVETSDSPWFSGPYGLLLEKARSVYPIPVKGALGIYTWSNRRTPSLEAPKRWMTTWGNS